jgi:hypothetical protein
MSIYTALRLSTTLGLSTVITVGVLRCATLQQQQEHMHAVKYSTTFQKHVIHNALVGEPSLCILSQLTLLTAML